MLLREALTGAGIFVAYYGCTVSLLLLVRRLCRPPRELFRKMLHIVCALSIYVLLGAFDTWYLAMLTPLAFALVVYPLIGFVERYPAVMEIFVQRRSGEVRFSLLLVFIMMAALIGVCWGWLGAEWKYVIILSVTAWGFGDAAAALVGKAWGRHHFRLPGVDGAKTAEGTLAMFLVALAVSLITLGVYQPVPRAFALLVAVAVAAVCAVVELVSHRGVDTITVPFGAAACTCLLIAWYNQMGGLT